MPGGVRLRTTLAAAAVGAIVFAIGGAALVLALRASLVGAAESTAEDRADALVATIESSGTDGLQRTAAVGQDEDEEDVADLAWQVVEADGDVVASAGTGGRALPRSGGRVHLEGDPYVVEARSARAPDDARFLVSVSASLEEAEESAEALVPVLAVGLPLALLVVAATTWVLVGRAFAPVRRIRAQVEQIGGGDLHQRVPVPPARDEIAGLARTMNAMLERLERAAVRQQRFVSDTSHELRSPLAGLRQTAEVARSHPAAVDREELVDAVLGETARLQNLVDQMLVLTRTEEGGTTRRTEVDVDDLVVAEAARLRRLRPDLTVDARGVEAARVLGDGAALGQVVRNLTDNAARHAAGVVRLRLRVTGGERVELTVEDDGSGVAAPDRDRVFERFVRLDEARSRDTGGSGLGLAIVREVARAHGGDASLGESELGGACFRVSVPGS